MSFGEIAMWLGVDAGPICAAGKRGGSPCAYPAKWNVNINGRSVLTCGLHRYRSDLLDGTGVAL